MNLLSQKLVMFGFSVTAFLGFSNSAHALNLITNGGFETTTNGVGQFDFRTIATGWSSSGYNFIFSSGSADSTGVSGESGNLKLWGPSTGSNNGLPASSPLGGNYVGADGAYEVGAITQTVNNLVVGQKYTLSFYWAGAQQSGYTGTNTEQWKVTLGTEEHDTVVLTNASHGFTGWQYQTFTYTATNTSEVLSFLAVGTPSGQPPFSLLDGVSLTAVPEPGEIGLMLSGLMVGLGYLKLKRRFLRKSGRRTLVEQKP